jgi:hypothetical protein
MPAKTLALHLRFARGFGHRVIEGEGVTFSRKRLRETHARRSLNIMLENSEGLIPMREGDTFGEINPH